MDAISTHQENCIPDKYYLAALCSINGVGRSKLRLALNILGSARAVFEASAVELTKLELFTPKQLRQLLEGRKGEQPHSLLTFCQQRKIRLMTLFEEDYPPSLKQIADPPLVLYVWGKIPAYAYAVAIVGSRMCDGYGIQATRDFSYKLAQRGVPIISGGAKGIDTVAHTSCLEAGGVTVAVLGCGIDIAYPETNLGLFQRIAQQGAVLTEFAPGVQPLALNFPMRNRIIVGLSQAVLVAQAARKSGAVITAHIAADEGREVYCVPGNIFAGSNLGCHDLIRKGAKLVDGAEDIIEDMLDWQAMMQSRSTGQVEQNLFSYQHSAAEEELSRQEAAAKLQAQRKQLEEAKLCKLLSLSEAARKIYAFLADDARGFDAIMELSGENFMTVSMAVLDLQVAGLIVEEGVQTYRRI